MASRRGDAGPCEAACLSLLGESSSASGEPLIMSQSQGVGSIISVLHETRVFPPPEAFARQAHISAMDQYEALWNRAKDDPEGFWAEQAQALHWDKPWDKVLEWNPPFAKWFVNAQTNVSYNCLDRQIELGRGDKAALLWEGEPESGRAGSGGAVHRITYRQLRDDVC